MGTVGKGGTPLVVPLRAVDERRQTAARSGECRDAWISGAVPHGSLARVACRSGASCVACGTVTRVPGDSPARLLHGHPSMRGGPVDLDVYHVPKVRA